MPMLCIGKLLVYHLKHIPPNPEAIVVSCFCHDISKVFGLKAIITKQQIHSGCRGITSIQWKRNQNAFLKRINNRCFPELTAKLLLAVKENLQGYRKASLRTGFIKMIGPHPNKLLVVNVLDGK